MLPKNIKCVRHFCIHLATVSSNMPVHYFYNALFLFILRCFVPFSCQLKCNLCFVLFNVCIFAVSCLPFRILRLFVGCPPVFLRGFPHSETPVTMVLSVGVPATVLLVAERSSLALLAAVSARVPLAAARVSVLLAAVSALVLVAAAIASVLLAVAPVPAWVVAPAALVVLAAVLPTAVASAGIACQKLMRSLYCTSRSLPRVPEHTSQQRNVFIIFIAYLLARLITIFDHG